MSQALPGRSPSESEISVEEAIGRVAAGDGWLLDVREPHEWRSAHAPDAHHIPMSELLSRQDELPDDETIYVICHVGGRSRSVTDALLAAGYPAVNVAGGMLAWHAADGPVLSLDEDN
ncbi:rhodanese-like domain-containing protein [Luethyella okanaganae]|uniref:Rhodanese-like domain-containing protein n=1 Tax=Luethyella okanaganae TaxID=69372 RepID=A0ABW1VEJ5_9MICO